jgi:uncharacterized protein (TIGR00661 family)
MASSNKAPKILYAVQGTGNGHVARAREIIPMLQSFGEVDVLLSGDQSNVKLPVPIKYRSKGLTFIYNRHGGLSYWHTLMKNNLWRIWRELRHFPVTEYDLVINDFEFISAWACRWQGKECISLGHQAAFNSKKVPRPLKNDRLGELVLRYYAPGSKTIGFHFKAYDQGIYPPVIRSEIRALRPENHGHYCVYLPAYGDDELQQSLQRISNRKWQVFTRYSKRRYQIKNVEFIPVNNRDFLESLRTCEGLLTSAGFESPAEALFLGKKVFVVPIAGQYEQFCNAAALKDFSVPCALSLNDKAIKHLAHWVYEGKAQKINFPDLTMEILKKEIFKQKVTKEEGEHEKFSQRVY